MSSENQSHVVVWVYMTCTREPCPSNWSHIIINPCCMAEQHDLPAWHLYASSFQESREEGGGRQETSADVKEGTWWPWPSLHWLLGNKPASRHAINQHLTVKRRQDGSGNMHDTPAASTAAARSKLFLSAFSLRIISSAGRSLLARPDPIIIGRRTIVLPGSESL